MPVEVTYEDRLRRTLSDLEAEREAFRKKASLVDLLEVTALAAKIGRASCRERVCTLV